MKYKGLVLKNREKDSAAYEKLYGKLVSDRFRKRYSQDMVEAIINNYMSEPSDEKYIAELKEMQEYRSECKRLAREELGVENENV